MTEIVIEENVACALVQLPEGIPCGSKVPHLTLGTRRGEDPHQTILEATQYGSSSSWVRNGPASVSHISQISGFAHLLNTLYQWKCTNHHPIAPIAISLEAACAQFQRRQARRPRTARQ